MPKCVCMTAKLKCSFGSGSKDMIVLPIGMAMNANTNPIATQMDFIPMLNIPAFGNCNSPANPMNWKMAGPVPVFVPSSCIPIPVMPGTLPPKNSKSAGIPPCWRLVRPCVPGQAPSKWKNLD